MARANNKYVGDFSEEDMRIDPRLGLAAAVDRQALAKDLSLTYAVVTDKERTRGVCVSTYVRKYTRASMHQNVRAGTYVLTHARSHAPVYVLMYAPVYLRIEVR